MPLDSTPLPEQSLEERALRHALAFFTDESKWCRKGMSGPSGSKCIGYAVLEYLQDRDLRDRYGVTFSFGAELDEILGLPICQNWNDDICPNFAALKAHLRARIAYYEDQRMKVAA